MTVLKKPRTEKQLARDAELGAAAKARAIFKTAQELTDKYEEYLKDQDDTFKSRPPSFSRFADWLGMKRSTIITYIGKWPGADEAIRRMTADIIFEHTVVADYRDAPGIFGLKNIAGWTDKKETITTSKQPDIATPDEAREGIQKIFESLGGTDAKGRLVAKSRKSLDEVKDRIIELEEVKTG